MSGEKSKVMAGLVIGMALGLAIAGGVAWYVVNRNPSEFTNREQAKPVPQILQLPASAPAVATTPASGVGETKQRFEFYKELTDKPDGTARKASEKPLVKPKEPTLPAKQAIPATTQKEMYYVQAGSFQNAGDAEKLKARLAFSGFEASIQTATIPDKGVWHRVRLGPYNGDEAGKTVTSLKQNGIIATQIHAQ